jgi:hypothetical protein
MESDDIINAIDDDIEKKVPFKLNLADSMTPAPIAWASLTYLVLEDGTGIPVCQTDYPDSEKVRAAIDSTKDEEEEQDESKL